MTIHELHARLGSAEAMARIVGCRTRIVQMWLKGTVKPPAHMLRLLHLAVTVPAARTELERLAGPKPPAKRPYKRRTKMSTTTTLKPAGYIVYDAQAIWGVGATEQEAWADFQQCMLDAHITVLDDDDDTIDQQGSWVHRQHYECKPATAALIEQVNDRGGDIVWRMSGGIACTPEEEN